MADGQKQFFSDPQEHTNPTSLMDAKQWAGVLLLLRSSGPFAFYNHRTTHCKGQGNHPMSLVVVVLQTS